MVSADLPAVYELMQKDEGVAFCPWEADLLPSALMCHPGRILLSACNGDEVIAACIGGSVGERATLSHVFVRAEHRRAGIGKAFFNMSKGICLERGVRQMYLVVTSEQAERFWRGRGFTASNAGFLQCELEETEASPDTAYSRPGAEAFVSTEETVLREGGLVAEDYGVRFTFFADSALDFDESSFCQLKSRLVQKGVKRGFILNPAPEALHCYERLGFREQKGEKLMEMRLDDRD